MHMRVNASDETIDIDEKSLVEQIDRCPCATFVLLVTLTNEKNSHSNIMVFNRNSRVIEHFDPFGLTSPLENAYHLIIKHFMDSSFPEWFYVQPNMLCPGIPRHPQEAESLGANFNKDGYCVMWSLYYVTLRLLNPNKTSDQTYSYLATHPGIFFEIQRFRCNVLDVVLTEVEQGRFHGYGSVGVQNVAKLYKPQLDACKKIK